MNLPNSITMFRIACIPLLIWALSPYCIVHGTHGEREIFASAIFILASITDGLDGYLARRRGQVTTMGVLLDPLADKLLITSGYICLIPLLPEILKPWIAVVIIGREFAVSGLRSLAASEGIAIQASEIGKLKTVIQIVSVVANIFALHWYQWDWGGFIVPVRYVAYVSTYWMVIVSIISATDYFMAFWKKLGKAPAGSRRKRKNKAVIVGDANRQSV